MSQNFSNDQFTGGYKPVCVTYLLRFALIDVCAISLIRKASVIAIILLCFPFLSFPFFFF